MYPNWVEISQTFLTSMISSKSDLLIELFYSPRLCWSWCLRMCLDHGNHTCVSICPFLSKQYLENLKRFVFLPPSQADLLQFHVLLPYWRLILSCLQTRVLLQWFRGCRPGQNSFSHFFTRWPGPGIFCWTEEKGIPLWYAQCLTGERRPPSARVELFVRFHWQCSL